MLADTVDHELETAGVTFTQSYQIAAELLPVKVIANLSGFLSKREKPRCAHLRLLATRTGKVVVGKSTYCVGPPLLPPKIKDGVFETISDALYSNCWSKKLNGEKSTLYENGSENLQKLLFFS